MSTWSKKTKTFVYNIALTEAQIDTAFETVYNDIINNLNGTPQDFQQMRIGNSIRVTVNYKQNTP